MSAEKKYNTLLWVAMVIGFGGFAGIVMVFSNMPAGSLLGPILVIVWALAVGFLLGWRFRIAKNSDEVKAQVKQDAEEFKKYIAKKDAKRPFNRLRRGMYGDEIRLPSDPEEDDEEKED